MLEHFHVKAEDEVRVMPDDLHPVVTQIFEKMNMPPDDAALAADVLVASDTRGVDTHGVSNMLRRYIMLFGQGDLNPRPNWKIVRETPSTATVDSDGGLGLVVAPKSMEIAIEKAKAVGTGTVTVADGRHLGMAAYHAMLALPHDMIGYCITGGGTNTVPTFGAEGRVGANPHAWAAPADKEPPFVLDISSSSVAANKIGLAIRNEIPLLPGLVADEQGTPIMEEAPPPPLEKLQMLPVGATRELGSHKGYGLSVVAQIFTGILSAGDFGPAAFGTGRMCHFLSAYNIEAFTDTAKFKTDMDAFLRYLRETPPAPGHDRVYYAGLPEHEESLVRMEKGIPLHHEVIDWFDSITAELGIDRLVR